jgi:hypothetical protein
VLLSGTEKELQMGFMDKVKSQATSIAAAGQAKVDSVQAKRHADSLLQDLGTLVYAQRVGRAGPDDAAKMEQIINDLQAHEQEHGQLQLTTQPDGSAGVPASGAPPSSTFVPSAAAPPASGSFIPTASEAAPAAAPFIPASSEPPVGASSIPTASSEPPVGASSIPTASSEPPAGESSMPTAEPPAGASSIPTAEPPAGASFIPTASESAQD